MIWFCMMVSYTIISLYFTYKIIEIVIIIEIKCTINLMCLNQPKIIPPCPPPPPPITKSVIDAKKDGDGCSNLPLVLSGIFFI